MRPGRIVIQAVKRIYQSFFRGLRRFWRAMQCIWGHHDECHYALATYRVVNNRDVQSKELEGLGCWWVRFGDQVLLYAANAKWSGVKTRGEDMGLHLEQHPGVFPKGELYLVIQKGRSFQHAHPDVPVIVDRGRHLAVRLPEAEAESICEQDEKHYVVKPLKDNTIVFEERGVGAAAAAPTPWVQALVNEVSRVRYEATLTRLVSSHTTRLTISLGYFNASMWCLGQFRAMGYTAIYSPVPLIHPRKTRNVVATKQGRGPVPRDLVLVVAHLDSRNRCGPNDVDMPAPGADDNASGSAAVLEIARILKDHRAVHDLRFVLFTGEEQGLIGSKVYVRSLSETDRARIRAVINMDMIGALNAQIPTVLLEGHDVSEAVIEALADSAATYTQLVTRRSKDFGRSDHVPFICADLPAVLTIEGGDDANSYIHTAKDTLDHIHYDQALDIIRMNLAYVATRLGRL